MMEEPTRALSLIQPWAELIMCGRKTIELRRWNTNMRGRVFLHASSRVSMRDIASFSYTKERLVFGALVGTIEIAGVKQYKTLQDFHADANLHLADTYAEDDEILSGRIRGFLVSNPERLSAPIQFKGMLNFFDVGQVKMKTA